MILTENKGQGMSPLENLKSDSSITAEHLMKAVILKFPLSVNCSFEAWKVLKRCNRIARDIAARIENPAGGMRRVSPPNYALR